MRLTAAWVWLLGPAVFIVSVLILMAARSIVLSAMRRTMGARRAWIDALVGALAPALTVALLVASLAVAVGLEPIPDHWRHIVSAVLTGGVILALVVFFDGLLTFWMRSEAVRFPMLGDSYGLITGFIRAIVFGLGVLMFLQSVGVEVGPILATLGIGSLAIALALQDTLKNALSGFFVIIDKSIKVGDYVKLASGEEGWLSQLGWRSSRFRMMNDSVVVVPNSQLVDAIVTNLRTPEGALSVEIDLTVAAGSDLDKVERITTEVACDVMKAANSGDSGHAPSVYFRSVSAGAVGMAVLLRVSRSADIEKARHQLIKRLTDRYAKEEIKLA
ncbi:MAG TPA: mechanosensitive ion channel domain-containing protein [Candidatus Binataceae bacterium]|nr:mechanosensitive ion channel domain-containing protein [Candidatus Binataceae bacterium]